MIVDPVIVLLVIAFAANLSAVIAPAAILAAVIAFAAISLAVITPVAILSAVIVLDAILAAVIAPSTINSPLDILFTRTFLTLKIPLNVGHPSICTNTANSLAVDGIVMV